jgi:hypothetical protein
MKTLSVLAFATTLTITLVACEKAVNDREVENEKTEQMNRLLAGKSSAAKLGRPQCWADCYLFDGVATPANFKPESDPFDELYVNNLGVGFMDGKICISESKPGDRDYNGGRWHVNVIRPDVDPMKYAGACVVEALDLADFMSTDTYFECPLLPRK